MTHADPNTPPLELTGLPIATPIGFMAALGLLRVCAQDADLPVRLSWNSQHARLHGIDHTGLLAALGQHMRGRSRAPEFNFEVGGSPGPRGPVMHLREIPVSDYRTAAQAFAQDVRALGFLAGFGTDAVLKKDCFVARTGFDFSSGNQRQFDLFRRLAAELDPDKKRPSLPWLLRAERALFGGPYENQHSFGWDPACKKTHAHQAEAPESSPKPGQPMTIWLAVESLPLHPVVPVSPRRAQTVGFSGSKTYVWPQWEVPLTLAEVTLLRQRPIESLDQLPGVTGLWSSERTRAGHYGVFRPAARIPSVAPLPDRFATESDPE